MSGSGDRRRAAKGAKPVADLVGAAILTACRKRGFAAAEIVTLWAELVDPEIARSTRPERIDWPRRRGFEDDAEPATLVLACDAAGALLVSHQAPQILERLNAFLGWRAIGRVRVVQRPARPRPEAARPERRPLTPAAERRLAEAVGAIAAPPLAAALARLGRAALAEVAAPAGGSHNRPNPRTLSAEDRDRGR